MSTKIGKTNNSIFSLLFFVVGSRIRDGKNSGSGIKKISDP
jgi:hypothetical protein